MVCTTHVSEIVVSTRLLNCSMVLQHEQTHGTSHNPQMHATHKTVNKHACSLPPPSSSVQGFRHLFRSSHGQPATHNSVFPRWAKLYSSDSLHWVLARGTHSLWFLQQLRRPPILGNTRAAMRRVASHWGMSYCMGILPVDWDERSVSAYAPTLEDSARQV